MEMSSLVAYEDSESEDESVDQTKEGEPASVQKRSCEQSHVMVCNSSEVTVSPHSFTPDPDSSLLEYNGSVQEGNSFSIHPHSRLRSFFDWQRQNCSDGVAGEKHCGETTAPLSLGLTRGTISPMQTPPHTPQRFGDELKPPKRHCTVPSGVRPYIPKRQRLATSEEAVGSIFPVEHVSGNQTRESQILSQVSERVKPYLAHKPGTAGIPRRLLMNLGGHQGPVNTVQWCPVPHLSHLLLSASMDKTVKVKYLLLTFRCYICFT